MVFSIYTECSLASKYNQARTYFRTFKTLFEDFPLQIEEEKTTNENENN